MMGGSAEGPRIWVVGISGAGKTTVAGQAAKRLGIMHLQLDEICQVAGLTNGPEIRRIVGELLQREAWAADGNHPMVRDLLKARATTIVWIDLSRFLVIVQVIGRWFSRALKPRSFRDVNLLKVFRGWLARGQDIPWSRSTYAGRQSELSKLLDGASIRLQSRRAVRAWIESLPRAAEAERGITEPPPDQPDAAP